MSDLVKPGITKAMVEQHLSLLGAYTLAGIDASCTEVGIAWTMGNAEWDVSIVGVEGGRAMAATLTWEGDTPYDEGDYCWSRGSFDDPVEAVRDAVRQAFESMLARWDIYHDEEAPAAVGEGIGDGAR